VPIAGTPFTLNYNSDRVPGRTTDRSVIIPLSGATPPTPLRRIELQVLIAGEMFTQSFTATANQTATFTWDGKDAYGRTVQG